MKYPYIIACLGMGLVISCGHKQESHENQPKQSQPVPSVSAVTMPGSSEEVVMKAGDLFLTMADYNRCIDVHNLMGRHFSKRALANPRFQRDEVQRCFQTKFLKDYMA